VRSSTTSLHNNDFGLENLQHKPALNFLLMASRRPGLYRFEVGNHLPTSPQDLASKRAQYPPILAKNLQNCPEEIEHKNIRTRRLAEKASSHNSQHCIHLNDTNI
jgi:hypothetical protein